MGQIGGLSPEGSVALGILVGLVSTSIQSIGLTLQRKSHILEDEKDPSEYRRPPYRRRRWQIGMAMFIISNIAGSTIQITTLPLPVLSTLQASGLVFNTICATLILGEPFTRWSVGGTVLVCAGAVLIAIFGAIPEPAHNLDQLLALLGRKQFILWMIGQAIIVATTISGAKAVKYMRPWAKNTSRMRLFRGLAYGGVSGILSAHSLLVAKSAVELLVRTIVDHHNQFDRWQSWVILLALLALALFQLYYLHRGLRLCSTSVLYPFVFCVYNIIAILDGLIYFHETSRLTLLHGLLIGLGTLILLLGVLALSWRLNNDPTTKPPVAQNPLTPSLGFVDDESDSDLEIANTSDEEVGLFKRDSPTTPHTHSPSLLFHNRTPTFRSADGLNVPRSRRKGMAEDILEELEDGETGPGTPSPYSSIIQHRRPSSLSVSSPRPASRSGTAQGRRAISREQQDAIDGGDFPTEHTSLLKRADTGRSYRDTRRRSSARTQTGHIGSISARRRSASSSQQEALGGWWKMRQWWTGGKSKGIKADPDSTPNSTPAPGSGQGLDGSTNPRQGKSRKGKSNARVNWPPDPGEDDGGDREVRDGRKQDRNNGGSDGDNVGGDSNGSVQKRQEE